MNETIKSDVLVYIAFGSNLGDRNENIQQMLIKLAEIGGTSIRCSSLWRSEAVGMDPGAQEFINGAVELRTCLTALALLRQLQRLEIALGRPTEHGLNTDRVIDLDIISYGNQKIVSEILMVPHPRAQDRLFVLKPLVELAPDLKLSGFDKTVTELLQDAPAMEVSRQSLR
ncbi:MAG: 2-amino-4-hydroxy-6-hydroxymethyldihydropteridine diphosphokinase [Candidatus Azotimanducaceae bacterium]